MVGSKQNCRTLTIRMPVELHEVLKDAACYSGISLNYLMVGTLMKYFVKFIHKNRRDMDAKREEARKKLLDWASKNKEE